MVTESPAACGGRVYEGGGFAVNRAHATARVGWILVPPPLGDAAAPLAQWSDPARERTAAEGLRVLVIPADRYRSMQADSVTPLLAFALSVVEFLNDVSEGDDVDLRLLAEGRSLTTTLPALAADDVPHAEHFQVTDGNALFVAKSRGSTALTLQPFASARAPGPACHPHPSLAP